MTRTRALTCWLWPAASVPRLQRNARGTPPTVHPLLAVAAVRLLQPPRQRRGAKLLAIGARQPIGGGDWHERSSSVVPRRDRQTGDQAGNGCCRKWLVAADPVLRYVARFADRRGLLKNVAVNGLHLLDTCSSELICADCPQAGTARVKHAQPQRPVRLQSRPHHLPPRFRCTAGYRGCTVRIGPINKTCPTTHFTEHVARGLLTEREKLGRAGRASHCWEGGYLHRGDDTLAANVVRWTGAVGRGEMGRRADQAAQRSRAAGSDKPRLTVMVSAYAPGRDL